ncbi:hypothetical protein BDV12DRAFT_153561 [Aspergillus spectabilis]
MPRTEHQLLWLCNAAAVMPHNAVRSVQTMHCACNRSTESQSCPAQKQSATDHVYRRLFNFISCRHIQGKKGFEELAVRKTVLGERQLWRSPFSRTPDSRLQSDTIQHRTPCRQKRAVIRPQRLGLIFPELPLPSSGVTPSS